MKISDYRARMSILYTSKIIRLFVKYSLPTAMQTSVQVL